jgi:hypothetical protein
MTGAFLLTYIPRRTLNTKIHSNYIPRPNIVKDDDDNEAWK